MTTERFFELLPLAANAGKLVGLGVIELTGIRAVGVLGSKFNTGFRADNIAMKTGTVVGAAALLAHAIRQAD